MLPGHLAPIIYTTVKDPKTGKRRKLTLLQAILGPDARYEDYAFKDGDPYNYQKTNLVRINQGPVTPSRARTRQRVSPRGTPHRAKGPTTSPGKGGNPAGHPGSTIPTGDLTQLQAAFLAILPTNERQVRLAHAHRDHYPDPENTIAATIATARAGSWTCPSRASTWPSPWPVSKSS